MQRDHQLPKKWQWVALADICNIERGITFPNSAKDDRPSQDNVACLRTANIQDHIDWNDLIYVPRSYVSSSAKFLRQNDILISMANSRDLVGKVSIVDRLPTESTFGGFISSIRPTTAINPYFLFFFLSVDITQARLTSVSMQTTNIANISVGELSRFSIPLPPIEEQQEIVTILRQADDLRRLRNQANEKAQALVSTIYEEMFSQPQADWSERKLQDLLSLEAGKSIRAYSYPASEEKWGILKVSAVTYGSFLPEENKELPDDIAPISQYEVKEDDLLISRANTAQFVGASAIVRNAPRRLMMPDKLWRVILPDQPETNVYYLYGLLNTTQMRHEISRRASGTSSSMKNISQAKFLDIDIRLPLKDRQDEFERRVRLLWDEVIDKQDEAAKKFEELHQSLLTQAFTGELTANWREKYQTVPTITAPVETRDAPPQFNLDNDEGKDAFDRFIQKTVQDILQDFDIDSEQTKTTLNKIQIDGLANFNKVIQSMVENYPNLVNASIIRAFQNLDESTQSARQIYIRSIQYAIEAGEEMENATLQLASRLVELAALWPEGPDEAHPRYAILKELSKAQYQIYLAAMAHGDYFTPEILHETLPLPFAVVKDGINILTAGGLLVSVRLPVPAGNATSYTLAYRILHSEDNSKDADLALLQENS